MKTIRLTSMLVAVLAATAAAMPQGAPSSTPAASDKVVIEGWALSMGTVATGANQSIRITIDGWSNPQQRQLLISAFLEKKQDGLLRELEKQPELGRFNFPGYVGPTRTASCGSAPTSGMR